ncbi:hypothetical protein AB0H00_18185 [Nocardia sp. NPDC023852]|uniref:hypothetical protein n=1 Tax=Nocardia sp. NPDC023852 TaxID=3154697 RepID=UPI0033D088CD
MIEYLLGVFDYEEIIVHYTITRSMFAGAILVGSLLGSGQAVAGPGLSLEPVGVESVPNSEPAHRSGLSEIVGSTGSTNSLSGHSSCAPPVCW